MVKKELIDYIKSVKEKGYTEETIKAILLQNNYSQEEIDEAFKELLLPQLSPQSVEPKQLILNEKNKKSGIPVVFLIMFALLILGGVLFAVWKLVPIDLSQFIFGSSSCKEVDFDVYHLKDEPVVCVFPDNSKVQLILQNKGTVELSKVEITVSGSMGESYDIIENLNLKSQEVFTRTFNYTYSEAGDIQRVALVPYVSVNGRLVECSSKKIVYDNINSC